MTERLLIDPHQVDDPVPERRSPRLGVGVTLVVVGTGWSLISGLASTAPEADEFVQPREPFVAPAGVWVEQTFGEDGGFADVVRVRFAGGRPAIWSLDR